MNPGLDLNGKSATCASPEPSIHQPRLGAYIHSAGETTAPYRTLPFFSQPSPQWTVSPTDAKFGLLLSRCHAFRDCIYDMLPSGTPRSYALGQLEQLMEHVTTGLIQADFESYLKSQESPEKRL